MRRRSECIFINLLNFNTMTVTVKEIEIGQRYHISGDIDNGFKDGKPYLSHDEVTRRIKRITDTHVVCECDRKFIINENLKISIPGYR